MHEHTIGQLKAGLAEAEQALWLNLDGSNNEFRVAWFRVSSFCQKLRLVMQAKFNSVGTELQEAYDVNSKFLDIYAIHLLTTLKEYRSRKGLQ